jgi:glutamyl-tRNA synthetase
MQASVTTRLAPSPTGALHLGNARTFLVNWALARRSGWRIVHRIEDLDTPRIKPGAITALLQTLHWLGMEWDAWEPAINPDRADLSGVIVQSEDLRPYQAAIRTLAAQGLAYPCALSRGEIEAALSAPQEGAHETPFPAMLRPDGAGQAFDFDAAAASGSDSPNWRYLTPPGEVRFTDGFAGPQSIDPSQSVGDFVLWTKRGQPSYQLAVVVDDHRQGVTQIIRGDDLLDSAARQLLLWRALDLSPEPRFTHLPLVLGSDGRRLAKRHGDTRIDHYRAHGVPAEAIIGLVAFWCGTLPRREQMSAPEFRDALSLGTIPHAPITFTPEDDRWLLSQAR